jgi:hypothetical protein
LSEAADRQWQTGDRVAFSEREGIGRGTVEKAEYGRLFNGRYHDLIAVRHDSDGHLVVHLAQELVAPA